MSHPHRSSGRTARTNGCQKNNYETLRSSAGKTVKSNGVMAECLSECPGLLPCGWKEMFRSGRKETGILYCGRAESASIELLRANYEGFHLTSIGLTEGALAPSRGRLTRTKLSCHKTDAWFNEADVGCSTGQLSSEVVLVVLAHSCSCNCSCRHHYAILWFPTVLTATFPDVAS